MAFVLEEVQKPSFSTKAIVAVTDAPPMPRQTIALYSWMEDYYPTRSSSTLQLFLPNTLSKTSKDPVANATNLAVKQTESKPPKLTSEQAEAIKTVLESKASSFLLHGETGSGKTRVYAELAADALQHNKSAVILTPEIGLTSQLAAQLNELLPTEVIVLHSQITPKQRRNYWQKIAQSSEALVVIGTRSALFSPIKHLGIVIVDEAHDDAYKQEQAPHYLATRVAAKLANLHQAKLVLGSATPPIADYSLFESKNLPIITMTSSATSASEVDINVVDLKERHNFTSSPYLSKQLVHCVENALSEKEQALIYLNRRGTARLVLCQKCGWESTCPRCDIALTFHDDTHSLVCHICGLTERPPSTCPSCASPDIFYKSIGTKALISHLKKLFPDATIERFDTDLKKGERLESRYAAVRGGEIDILVGTQLLGKGLDLPLLSVVGIVQADSSLLLPDFSAREKTYQQLHQIIGRVGRGHRKGHVIVQTHNPDSPLMAHALKKDYLSFYKDEVVERKTFLYPPFCHMLHVRCARKSSSAAEKAAEDLRNEILRLSLPVQIIGPSPAFKAKAHNNYYWQLVIKSKQRAHLLHIVDTLPKTADYNIDPINLL